MAATDARPVPRKNTAFRFYFALRNLSTGALITTWAGADSEVSLDGAAFSDCTNEATEIGTTGCGYIDFTSSEMNGDAVIYKLTVTNTNAETLVVTFFPEESGDYRADVSAASLTSINGEVVDALNVDTYAEPGQATPAATASLATKINYLYKNWRNRKTQTTTTWSLMNDDTTTVGQKSTVSDDGTTAEKTEVTTGP